MASALTIPDLTTKTNWRCIVNKKQLNKIKGATMTEYVLIIGLIAAGAVLALTSVGTGMAGFFTSLNTTVTNAAGNL